MPETVVLLHGLWFMGIEMSLLGYRIRKCGFQTRLFRYPTVRQNPSENALALQKFLQRIESETIHFVAHSLGGHVLCHLFHLFPEQKPGRIVTLATPHRGSAIAQRTARLAFGRAILGKSLERGLLGDSPSWTASHPLGVIAGTLPLGLGLLVGGIKGPNDGTVAVDETQLPGLADHIILPVSHFGMLVSPETVRQICAFLKQGHFNH